MGIKKLLAIVGKLSHRTFLLVLGALAIGVVVYRTVPDHKGSVPTVPLIPRSVLFSAADKSLVTISPNGRFLAYGQRDEQGIVNIWLRDLSSTNSSDATRFVRQITRDTRSVLSYFWSADSNYLFYTQDKLGNENWHLYGINLETGEARDYTPFEGVQARLITDSHQYPDTLLVALNKDDKTRHDVYRVTISTGELELIERNPGKVAWWFANDQLQVCGAGLKHDDGTVSFLYRKDNQESWKSVITWRDEESLMSFPLEFTPDGELYMLDARFTNTPVLVRYNCSSNTMHELARDERYGIAGVLLHPTTRVLQGYFIQKDRRQIVSLDDSITRDLELLKDTENKSELLIESRNDDDTLWVIAYLSDTGPVSYYLYNRVTGQKEYLFDNKPRLKSYTFAPMESISLVTRDNFVLEGYCTYPVGVARTNLPLVLLVHGGPQLRDTWGFHTQAQWFANRGYACLQINFRGSTGYGKKFIAAANKEWGGTMLNDLVDAARWAIEEKIADPKKIVIFGSSYGGYAALCGVSMTDIFAAGVAIVGPSNLVTFLESIPAYWEAVRASLYYRIGHPEHDAELLKNRSPLTHVDKIKVPLFVVHGAHDSRVNQREAEQIVAKLKEKNIEHEYLLFPDEGHSIIKEENRLLLCQRVEQFLARVLGGRCEQ